MVVFGEEVEHAPLRRTCVLAQMWVPSGLPSRSASRRAMVETERMFHSTDGAGVDIPERSSVWNVCPD